VLLCGKIIGDNIGANEIDNKKLRIFLKLLDKEQKWKNTFLFILDPILMQVPPTLRFVMDGEMPNYLLAKDLILQVSVLDCS